MARPERETKTYITWIPFLIDSMYMSKQEWHIIEKERVQPKWKVLIPLSLVFPMLRVTYERIVAGGMLPPETFQLANWMATNEPGSLQDRRYSAFFASTLESSVSTESPVAPTNPARTDVIVSDAQEKADSESSSSQPPPAPRIPPHYYS